MPESNTTRTHEWGSQPEMFGPRHEHRLGMFTRHTAKLLPGSRVLDAAVGLGQLSGRLKRQGHRTFGIDGAFQAALYAKRTGSAETVVGDMTMLPFRDGAFEAVTSGETLEHLDDDSAAASEITRVLGREGMLVVTVPALESLWTRSDDYYEHRRRYTRTGLKRLFGENLEIREARYWGFPVVLIYDTLFLLPMNIRRSRLAVASEAPGGSSSSKDSARGESSGSDVASRPERSTAGIECDPALRAVASAGSKRWLVNLVRAAFALDSLFSWLPFGPGLLLVGRKQ